LQKTNCEYALCVICPPSTSTTTKLIARQIVDVSDKVVIK